ncbi:MAG: hypothetical protein ACI8T1_002466 [Verrucomicrobiales bacterium]|jgi:hypothetical protein
MHMKLVYGNESVGSIVAKCEVDPVLDTVDRSGKVRIEIADSNIVSIRIVGISLILCRLKIQMNIKCLRRIRQGKSNCQFHRHVSGGRV